MAWIGKTKDLSLHSTTPHACSLAGVSGRAPGFGPLTFGPMDLYGAAARCSHLHFVNPALSSPESDMIKALLEQYVDDVSNDFAILSTADRFKDFVKSYFSGTVAAGLAYLAMIDDGYVWSDHFENLGGGNPSATQKPDFVFTGPGVGTALLESKGTRAAGLGAFDSTVDAGYVGQVEPHLGYSVGGAMATHGYGIGAWLTSTLKAELLVHHTDVPGAGGGGPSSDPPTDAILRQNYAAALTLAHSYQFGAELRKDDGERHEALFVRIEWRGKMWRTGLAPPRFPWGWDGQGPLPSYILPDGLRRDMPDAPSPFFAIEETIAESVLSRFHALRAARGGYELIEPLRRSFWRATRGDEGPQSGAVFPDGLAVIRRDFRFAGWLLWSPEAGRFADL